jgi:hypothetical protein
MVSGLFRIFKQSTRIYSAYSCEDSNDLEDEGFSYIVKKLTSNEKFDIFLHVYAVLFFFFLRTYVYSNLTNLTGPACLQMERVTTFVEATIFAMCTVTA